MAKRIIYGILVAITALTVCIALVACKPKAPEEPDAYVVTINTADDLKNVKLGYGAKNAVYELNADLTIDEWAPLGTSIAESFRGEFRGNGHTISYSVVIDEPEERDVTAKIPDEAYYGLFGVTYDVTVKDLTVDAYVKVPTMAESVSVGGLIAYAFGNTTLNNVKVTGSVVTTLGDIRTEVVNDDGSKVKATYAEEMSEHIGGVIGNVTGKIDAVEVSSSARVKAENDNIGNCLVKYVSIGGLFGTLRTVDISSGSSDVNKLNGISYDGNVEAYGAKVNIGGVVGTVYHTEITDVTVNSSLIKATAYQRINIGGIGGITDGTDVKKAKVEVEELTTSRSGVRNNRFKSYNVGGAIGYASNRSTLQDAYVIAKKVTVPDQTDNYVGGIVGMAHYSHIESAYASGELFINNTSISEFGDIKYGLEDRQRTYYIYSGGAIGKLYGKSTVKTIATEFKAYQGVVGTAYDAVEIVSVVVSDGETIDSVLANMGYDRQDTDVTVVGEQKRNGDKVTQDYKLVHKYNASASDLYYYSSNARCNKDGAQAFGYLVKYGTALESDDSAMSTAKQNVLDKLAR